MESVGAEVPPEMRPMRVEDVERVSAIEAASFSSAWQPDTFLSLLDRPGPELWVLEHPVDGVIGYFVLWCILDQGELANIALAHGHRGRGLGATLLGRVVEVARTREVTSIYLEVRASNESALRLYDRFGFTRVGVRKRYYDQPKEDAIVMLLAL